MQAAIHPFHLAFPVHDLKLAREFYGSTLGCDEGRSSDEWIDFSLYGHQIVTHLAPREATGVAHRNEVDQHHVPVPHFGVVLPWDQFHSFADRLKAQGVQFVIDPCIRFEGQVGEQATMFFMDPSGNALEFKSFKDIGQLFAK
jgi:uncharacterized protein